jgi:hypothetical protein
MPTPKGREDLAKEERSAFLASCWKRGYAPTDEAWERHLRLAAHRHLRHAHDLLHYALDPEWESGEAHDEATDRLIAWLNHSGAMFRMSGLPHIPFDRLDDDEVMPAWEAREEALRTMPYSDYLRTPEWTERRRSAVRRAGQACQTCGGQGRLHVHHRTYERRGEELADDLTVLCENCHLAVHTTGGSHRPAGRA